MTDTPNTTSLILAAAQEIERLRAAGRASLARADELEQILDQPSQKLRMALGTEVPPPPLSIPALPPPIMVAKPRRGRPPKTVAPVVATAAAPVAPPAPAPETESLYTKLRVELSERSLTPKQLAKVLHIPLETVENVLTDLRRNGQVYRFEEDDSYCWCVGEIDGTTRREFVVRLLSTPHHMTRHVIWSAIGSPPGDTRTGFKRNKDIDNTLDFIRGHYPVWCQADERGDNVYWLVKNEDGTWQKPPKNMDGGKVKRHRPGPKKKGG